MKQIFWFLMFNNNNNMYTFKVHYFYYINWPLGSVFWESLVLNHSCVQLFVTPWTVACQAPLFMWFLRQEYWSGLTFPSPVNLLNSGIEPLFPMSPILWWIVGWIPYLLNHQRSSKSLINRYVQFKLKWIVHLLNFVCSQWWWECECLVNSAASLWPNGL